MTKTFKFGKIAYDNASRKANEVEVEINYGHTEDGKPRFSAMGAVWNSSHTDWVAGGQCLDDLAKYLGDNDTFKTIYGLWKRNHLNDCSAAANDAQALAVQEFHQNGGAYDYDAVCEYLKGKGLYEVTVDGKPCRYGDAWYYREISDADKAAIEKLLAQ